MVLSAHPKEADARADQTAKTAVARSNYGFKTLNLAKGLMNIVCVLPSR